jgi:hypothetical protein
MSVVLYDRIRHLKKQQLLPPIDQLVNLEAATVLIRGFGREKTLMTRD